MGTPFIFNLHFTVLRAKVMKIDSNLILISKGIGKVALSSIVKPEKRGASDKLNRIIPPTNEPRQFSNQFCINAIFAFLYKIFSSYVYF